MSILVVILTLVLPLGAGGDVSNCEELRIDLDRLETFEEAPDLARFEEFVSSRRETWKQESMFCFGHFVLKAVQILGSTNFGDDRQYELLTSYARLGLESGAQKLPLEVEIKLVQYTEIDLTKLNRLSRDEWMKQRSRDLKYWFLAWEHVDAAIDNDWDPADLPLTNVVPPTESRLPAGVAPEAVADPGLRAEYQEAIRANREKAEYYREQYQARKLRDRFAAKAERYIIAAYSQPPSDLEELRVYLEQHVRDQEVHLRVIQAVRKNIGM